MAAKPFRRRLRYPRRPRHLARPPAQRKSVARGDKRFFDFAAEAFGADGGQNCMVERVDGLDFAPQGEVDLAVPAGDGARLEFAADQKVSYPPVKMKSCP